MKKSFLGFTLAEVLITLGIIGVVAALTMPTLIENHQKSVTVNSLKKFYSTISQAKVASELVNGEFEYWDFSKRHTKEDKEKIFDKYFRPFLNIAGECDAGKGCIDISAHSAASHPHYVLSDGTIFQFVPDINSKLGNFIYLLVDVNGAKGPDKFGRDVFALDVYVKYGVVMLGTISEELNDDGVVTKYKLSSRDELINGTMINYGITPVCCSKDKSCGTHNMLNINCGALIQMDGWQIKDDYPW